MTGCQHHRPVSRNKQRFWPIFRLTVILVCCHFLIMKEIPPVVTGKWTGNEIVESRRKRRRQICCSSVFRLSANRFLLHTPRDGGFVLVATALDGYVFRHSETINSQRSASRFSGHDCLGKSFLPLVDVHNYGRNIRRGTAPLVSGGGAGEIGR
jgi:hypothetical protein